MDNGMTDYYSLLGIKRSASPVEIKNAYRRMVFRYHPDRNPEDGEAADKFKLVLEAYDTLSDADKRLAYDRATRSMFQDAEEPRGNFENEPPGAGFRFSHEFKAKAEPEPKCPECSVSGTEHIVSRKAGVSGGRGKQFVLSPFQIIFCSRCGHVYGVTGLSS